MVLYGFFMFFNGFFSDLLEKVSKLFWTIWKKPSRRSICCFVGETEELQFFVLGFARKVLLGWLVNLGLRGRKPKKRIKKKLRD